MTEKKLGFTIGGFLLLIDLAFTLYTRMPDTRIPSNSGWDLVSIGV